MGEPKKLEYRYNGSYLSGCYCHWLDEGGIDTTSLLFVKKSYLKKAKSYLDGKIFENRLEI